MPRAQDALERLMDRSPNAAGAGRAGAADGQRSECHGRAVARPKPQI
jgi:hypothetical protein